MSGAELIVGIGLAASLIECIRTGRAALKTLQSLRSGNKLCDDNATQLSSLLAILEKVDRRVKTFPPQVSSANSEWAEWNDSLAQEVEGCYRHVRRLKAFADEMITTSHDGLLTRLMKSSKGVLQHRELLRCYNAIGTYRTSIMSLMTAAMWEQMSTLTPAPVPLDQEQQFSTSMTQQRSTTTRFTNMPTWFDDTKFVGQAPVLSLIRDSLEDKKKCNIVSIHGLGGVGKTQVALKYAHDAYENRVYDNVFWFDGSSEQKLDDSISAIESSLRSRRLITDHVQQSHDSLVPVCQYLHHTARGYLLIFDNCDDPGQSTDAIQTLSAVPNGRVLITSRISTPPASLTCTPIAMRTMSNDDGVELLERSAHIARQEALLAVSRQVADQLGNLPLALAILGRYMAFTGQDMETINRRFRSELEIDSAETQHAEYNGARVLKRHWEAAYQTAGKGTNGPAITRLLRCLSLLDSSHISEDVLRDAVDTNVLSGAIASGILGHFMKNGAWNHAAFESIIIDLDSIGLLAEVDHDSRHIGFALRPQFADWLRGRVDNGDVVAAISMLGNYLEHHQQRSGPELSSIPLRRRQEINAHIDACLEHLQNVAQLADIDSDMLKHAKYLFATFLKVQRRQELAQILFEEALPLQSCEVGPASLLSLVGSNTRHHVVRGKSVLREDGVYARL